MKKIALLTLLLINLSLSFSLPRNQASPAIFSVTKTNNSILFRHTDSTLTAIPCQSVASIVSNADPSKIISVWVVQQGDYDKIMQFDYSVCGFSSKSDAVDSLTAWAICDTSSGGGGGGGDVTQAALDDSILTLRSIRKVDTSYTFRNSTLDSLCQITIINGISYRSCGKDSVGAGSSTLALDKITDAVDSSTLNAGNYKQEWQWNSLANNTGLKLSSTSGGLLNTQNRLFEVEMSGVMPGVGGSSSYAGYFKNTQTNGSAAGLYVEGVVTAINTVGNIRIDGGSLSLGINGAMFYRNSGTTYLHSATGEQLILVSQNATAGNINFQCSAVATDIGFQIAKKTINQHYIFGLGGARYNGNYVSASSTSACIMERNANKIIFSANSGLPGGGTVIYVPNNILTINGGATEATSNVGIGTTTPDASAKLEVSSTTSGFLPPRMTATQASAISTPAQGLLLFVTDTDGTFTSVGWWGYNGATWEKLNN